MTNARRELMLVLVLAVVGGAVVLVASGQPWAHAVVSVSGSPQAPQRVDLSGRTVAPLVAALGLVVLAAVVALLATRSVARMAMGVVIALAGALIIGATASTSSAQVRNGSALHDRVSTSSLRDARVSVQLQSWRHVAAGGGLLIVAAGLIAAARGRSWVGMGRRFDAPTAAAAAATPAPAPATTAAEGTTDADLWDRIERGEDPTG
jgi:uncharacterized membrane protein (TIGR02234 family)